MPTLPPAALAKLHRYSGAILGLFIVTHLINHLFLLQGPARHIQVMETLRQVYRWPPLEALLLGCVLVQVVTGFMRLKRGGKVATPARIAGMYLLYFMLAHTFAVLAARGWLQLDSNLYFAAAGLHVWPLPLYFAPYYVLAVVAVFVHLGSALAPRLGLRTQPARNKTMLLGGAAGALLGAAIVVAMAAGTVRIPPEYTSVLRALLPA